MIQPLTLQHLSQAVALHMKILGWSINARLGASHLTEVYTTLIEDSDCLCFADTDADGSLLALIITSTDWQETRKKISGLYSWKKKCRMLVQSLRKPADYLDIIENLICIIPTMKKQHCNAEILIWLSDTSHLRGKVSGVKIMRNTLHELDKLHMLPAIAQVAKYDPTPNLYHKNSGNQLVRSFIRNNIYLLGFPS